MCTIAKVSVGVFVHSTIKNRRLHFSPTMIKIGANGVDGSRNVLAGGGYDERVCVGVIVCR